MRHHRQSRWLGALVALLVFAVQVAPMEAQVRRARRGRGTTVIRGEERTIVANRRGVAVKGDEGYAAVGRRGGVIASNEERTIVSNRRGTIVAGEEGFVAGGRPGYYRPGVIVGGRYEDNEGWKTAARVAGGVAAGIAVGTMLSRPPARSVTVTVAGSNYWYDDGVYYARAFQGGDVVYQVVPAPPGAVIATLPGGCTSVRRGNVTYSQCGGAYYQRVSGGYRVAVF
jgi:hypothetical protein